MDLTCLLCCYQETRFSLLLCLVQLSLGFFFFGVLNQPRLNKSVSAFILKSGNTAEVNSNHVTTRKNCLFFFSSPLDLAFEQDENERFIPSRHDHTRCCRRRTAFRGLIRVLNLPATRRARGVRVRAATPLMPAEKNTPRPVYKSAGRNCFLAVWP